MSTIVKEEYDDFRHLSMDEYKDLLKKRRDDFQKLSEAEKANLKKKYDNFQSLSIDEKKKLLNFKGYVVDDECYVISYKAVSSEGFDMFKAFQYTISNIGKIIVDEYSDERFHDPQDHTGGGIYSSSLKNQELNKLMNFNSILNHYIKIKSHINDIQLDYLNDIKSKQIILMEIQGKTLKV